MTRGARLARKIRVHEMVDDETSRTKPRYLLVRGGVHIVAYSRALEKLTGVDVGRLLPIPDISNRRFPEVREHGEKGLHRILYRSSRNDDKRISEIRSGHRRGDVRGCGEEAARLGGATVR